jgi:hypothetical protein
MRSGVGEGLISSPHRTLGCLFFYDRLLLVGLFMGVERGSLVSFYRTGSIRTLFLYGITERSNDAGTADLYPRCRRWGLVLAKHDGVFC